MKMLTTSLDAATAARNQVEKMLLDPDFDRIELMEFVDVVYGFAQVANPVFKRARSYATLRELDKKFDDVPNYTRTEPEPLAEQMVNELLALAYQPEQLQIAAPLPEGVIEACDETLNNFKENEMVTEYGNPFKLVGIIDEGVYHEVRKVETLKIK